MSTPRWMNLSIWLCRDRHINHIYKAFRDATIGTIYGDVLFEANLKLNVHWSNKWQHVSHILCTLHWDTILIGVLGFNRTTSPTQCWCTHRYVLYEFIKCRTIFLALKVEVDMRFDYTHQWLYVDLNVLCQFGIWQNRNMLFALYRCIFYSDIQRKQLVSNLSDGKCIYRMKECSLVW